MASMRTYGDGCGVAHALDLVGERWALLVVRDLLLGPKRFTDLRAGLRGASPNVLAQRLRELEQAGVVRRRRLPPPAGSAVYELTDWGRELEPILITLGVWGVRSPSFSGDAPVGMDSVLLALRTFFAQDAAEGFDARYELGLGESRFRIRISDGSIELARGEEEDPDAVIDTELGTLRELLWGGRALDDALRAGDIRIEGDRHAVDRLLGLFPQPEPAAAAVA
jgi:DNA-binding HxlR family transcriptional regulator/putative sterol carrier protein